MERVQVPLSSQLIERDCFSAHLGVWCVEPQTASHLRTLLDEADVEALIEQAQEEAQDGERHPVIDSSEVVGSTAVIPVTGSLTKARSTLGGTSTVDVRQALSHFANQDGVENIVLRVDSPGGHVAGVPDLANDVRRIAEDQDAPRVTAVIEDMGASAAFWVASQANAVFATNDVTKVGSIGVRTVVHDVSDKFEEAGIEVVSIASGERKDDFVEGQPIEEEAIAHHQQQIEAMHDIFVQTVARGLDLPEDAVEALATGETFLVSEPEGQSLVDGVKPLREVIEDLEARAATPTGVQASDVEPAEAEAEAGATEDLNGGLADNSQVTEDLASLPLDLTGNVDAEAENISVDFELSSVEQPEDGAAEPSESLNRDDPDSTGRASRSPQRGKEDTMSDDDGEAEATPPAWAQELKEELEETKQEIREVKAQQREDEKSEVAELLAGEGTDPSEVEAELEERGFTAEQLQFLKERAPDLQAAPGVPDLQDLQDVSDLDGDVDDLQALRAAGVEVDSEGLQHFQEEKELKEQGEDLLRDQGIQAGGDFE